MSFRKTIISTLGAMSLMLPVMPSVTQAESNENDRPISIQLNNMVAQDGACRLSFMIRNGLSQPLLELGVEIVLLDKLGMAQDFMVLRAQQLAEGKRRIMQFDLPNVGCDDLGEIVINDVADCKADGMTAASCLAALEPSSLTSVKLGL